jgi:hypothetical protein
MSFLLAAFIGNEPAVAAAASLAGCHRVARLGHDLHLVELTADGMSEPQYSELFHHLTPPLAAAASTASAIGDVGYIEANFFGGDGNQSCIVWRDGEVVLGALRVDDEEPPTPRLRDWPINRALRFFGVKAQSGHDEFDTVNLGRFR